MKSHFNSSRLLSAILLTIAASLALAALGVSPASAAPHAGLPAQSNDPVCVEIVALTVSLSGPDMDTVNEGESATYTVTVTGGFPSQPLTVSYATSDGTATAGEDYTAAVGAVTIPADGTTIEVTFTVNIADDSLPEGDEDFTVAISNPVGGGGTRTVMLDTTMTSVSTTIKDNDGVTVRLSGPADAVNEGETATYTVSLTGSVPSQNLTVSYGTTDGTATAVVDTEGVFMGDYHAVSGPLTFPADGTITTHTFTVDIQEDNDAEPDETFTVTITITDYPGPEAVMLEPATGIVTTTIAASDALTVSLSGPTDTVNEGETANYKVTVTGGDRSEALTVDYATGADADTATAVDTDDATADYGSVSGTLTIPAEEAEATFSVGIIVDPDEEPAETFTVTISNLASGNAPATLEPASVTTTIAASAASPCTPSTHDSHGDCLIDVDTPAKLAAIEFDRNDASGADLKLDGNGIPNFSAAGEGAANEEVEFRAAWNIADGEASEISCGGSACEGYELVNDIRLTGDWQPLGHGGNGIPYVAVFNGNGHTISGLRVRDGVLAAGLFDTVGPGGIIQRVTIENPDLNFSDSQSAGALAGFNSGTIVSSSVTGTGTVVIGSEANRAAGALVGTNQDTGIISGSTTASTITDGADPPTTLTLAGCNNGTITPDDGSPACPMTN